MKRGPDSRLGGHIFEINEAITAGNPSARKRTSDVASPAEFNVDEAELHADE